MLLHPAREGVDAIRTPTAKLKSGNAAATALVGIFNVLLASFILATLYFAQDLLVPLALAALLTFLLAPLVTRLERFMGRIGAVLLVVMLILGGATTAGWVLTRQLVDLATKLPDYKENIRTKLRSFKAPSNGKFEEISKTVEELKQELPGAEQPKVAQVAGDPSTAVVTGPEGPPAVPVEVINTTKANPLEITQALVAPLLGPLGTAALVLLLLIFLLLKREDLRSRMIRLIGQGRISSTTQAMDDAGARVRRYLLMQLVINVTYGIPVAIGLYFIGVPNAVLWGASATVLRFIPYVGPWIGAGIPTLLSLAVSPGWMMPLLTIGMFIVLELVSNNVLEPWLYGSSTGVSPVALIIAAVAWTWLWGPVGLVLATPLTVCLVVMGRHNRRLSFLSVLLSDEEALTPAEDFYHRLLTSGDQDEIEFVETFLKTNTETELYDSVFTPALMAVERDHRLELLEGEQRENVEQSLRDIVEDLGATPPVTTASTEEPETAIPAPEPILSRRVYCVPARAERDQLAAMMMAQLLRRKGHEAHTAPVKLEIDVLVRLIREADVDGVCISVVAPSTVLHARYLCLKLRTALPRLPIIVGLWGHTENLADAARRVRDSGADEAVGTMAEALLRLGELQVRKEDQPPRGSTKMVVSTRPEPSENAISDRAA
jgi:predicted PurR-regulated permease PerM